jgi:hypothetical protein
MVDTTICRSQQLKRRRNQTVNTKRAGKKNKNHMTKFHTSRTIIGQCTKGDTGAGADKATSAATSASKRSVGKADEDPPQIHRN